MIILIALVLSLLLILLIIGVFDIKCKAEQSKTCTSHILIEASSGKVLSGDNIHARLPMASTTKIMTALIAIESGKIDDEITITRDMVGVEGSSIYLKEGEKLTLRELVYGLMLRSGNDAAVAIAIGVAGNIDTFVNMMNDKVNTLELTDTHFVNPHGLHDDLHYTSAYDLAMISRCAMENSVFREIVSSKSKIICQDSENKRYLVNKNKILGLYDGGNGIKTGFTKKAGRCLVSSAKRGNMQLISVVLNEPDMWQYSMSSMDNAFDKYTCLEIANKDKSIGKVDINGHIYDVCTHKTLIYPHEKKEDTNLSYEIEIDKHLLLVKHKQKVGKILVYDNKHLIFDEKIYTI